MTPTPDQDDERAQARSRLLKSLVQKPKRPQTEAATMGEIDAYGLLAATLYAKLNGIPYSQESITELVAAAMNGMDLWRDSHDARN